MKKFTIAAVGIAMALLCVSCKKDDNEKKSLAGPSVTWEANPKFNTTEITDDMDVKLDFQAPAKFKTFTISMKAPSVLYYGAINQIISIPENKSTTESKPIVLDLINDSGVMSVLSAAGIPTGNSLLGKTTTTMNLGGFVPMLLAAGEPDNNSNFVFTVNVGDENGKTLTKSVTFHYTSAPTITWSSNPNFNTAELTTATKCELNIKAPGKIKSVTMRVSSPATTFLTVIDGMIGVSANIPSHTLDLIDDAKAVTGMKTMGVTTGTDLAGKTEVKNFSLSTFLPMMITIGNLPANTDHSFVITVTDENGKSVSKGLTFHYNG